MMAETSSSTPLALGQPDHFSCSNCACQLTLNGGAVNEIHIYSAANEFEKSVTILEALWEIFGTNSDMMSRSLSTQTEVVMEVDYLRIARDSGYTLLMCSRCAEVVSMLYKDFLNLVQISSSSGYLSKLLSHFESWKIKHDTVVVIYDDSTGDIEHHQPDESENFGFSLPQSIVPDCDYDYSGSEALENDQSLRKRLKKPKKRKLVLNNDSDFEEKSIKKSISKIARVKSASSSIQKKYTKARNNPPNRHFFKCHLCPKGFLLNWEWYEHDLFIHKGKQRHSCLECGFQYYPEIIKIETHKCINNSKRNFEDTSAYICEICGDTFQMEKLLKYHMDSIHIHEGIKYECIVCKRNLLRRSTLLKHSSSHGVSDDVWSSECTQCGMRFSNETDLDKHSSTAHVKEKEELPEVCPECGKGYQNRVCRLSHMRNVHGIRQRKQLGQALYPCDLCDKVFRQPKYLTGHKKFKHGSEQAKKFQCHICAKRFWTKSKVKSHMGIHTYGTNANTKSPKEIEQYDLNYKCKHCPLTFDYKTHMDLHNRNFHNTADPFICQLCKKPLPTHLQLLLHGRTHMSIEERRAKPWNASGAEGEFNCEQCGKSYKTLKNLFTHHTFVHTGNPRISCELCQKEVRTRNLFSHYKTHHPEKYIEVEKQLLADKLSGKVKTRGVKKEPLTSLPREKRILDRFIKLECEICKNGKIYSSRSTLREHKAMHTGRHLRVTCGKCGKQFRSNGKLKLHDHAVHTERIPQEPQVSTTIDIPKREDLTKLICTVCNNGKIYASRKTLREHYHMHNETHLRVECTICGHRMRSTYKLNIHMKSIHPPKIRNDLSLDIQEPEMKRKKIETQKSESISILKNRRVYIEKIPTSTTQDLTEHGHSEFIKIGNSDQIETTKRLQIRLNRVKIEICKVEENV